MPITRLSCCILYFCSIYVKSLSSDMNKMSENDQEMLQSHIIKQANITRKYHTHRPQTNPMVPPGRQETNAHTFFILNSSDHEILTSKKN